MTPDKKKSSGRSVKSKKGGKGRIFRTPIISAKKKSTKDVKWRFIVFSFFLLVALTLLIVIALHLMKGRVTLVSTPYPEKRIIEKRVEEINADLDLALLELGISKDLLIESGGHQGEGGESISSLEKYHLPKGMKKEEFLDGLNRHMGRWKGVIEIDTSDVSDGVFEVSIYAFGWDIRKIRLLPPVAPLPMVAIIMDDLGTNKKYWKEIFSLKYPVTLSILPHQAFSTELARRAYKEGSEVILHIPMEPIDYLNHNPGTGALLVSMTEEELIETLLSDLSSVPYICGVNNHMGSLFTQDKDKMEIVLGEINKKGLFFVDSRTTPKSLAFETAVGMGVPTLKRSVFLDNDRKVDKIKGRIEELMKDAKEDGFAVGICHPYPETIKALKEMEPVLFNGDVKVVNLSDLIGRD
jgi:polysaccharide deacetylase 2 family uncharacterized protein YibQ